MSTPLRAADRARLWCLAALIALLPGCAVPPQKAAVIRAVPAAAPPPAPPAVAPAPAYAAAGPTVTGYASWYERSAVHNRTCTGQRMDNNAMAAASHSLRPGTMVRVTLVREDRSVVVVVDDCMPHGRHIIDLSKGAAERLGLIEIGSAPVQITPLEVAEAP